MFDRVLDDGLQDHVWNDGGKCLRFDVQSHEQIKVKSLPQSRASTEGAETARVCLKSRASAEGRADGKSLPQVARKRRRRGEKVARGECVAKRNMLPLDRLE